MGFQEESNEGYVISIHEQNLTYTKTLVYVCGSESSQRDSQKGKREGNHPAIDLLSHAYKSILFLI